MGICVYVCVCVYMHIYIPTDICMHIHTSVIFLCMYIHMPTWDVGGTHLMRIPEISFLPLMSARCSRSSLAVATARRFRREKRATACRGPKPACRALGSRGFRGFRAFRV